MDLGFSFNLISGALENRFEPMLLQSQEMCLSHNNLCFPCNIVITNFPVSHTFEIRFHEVTDRTVHNVYIMTSS